MTRLKTGWYKSKTIWFNIALGLIGVIEASTGTMKELVGDHYGVVMMVVAMIGMWLRTITTTPLKDK